MRSESARAVVIKEDKILLIYIKEKDHIHYGIPGGKKKDNEIPEDTVIREVFEETSINVGNPIYIDQVTYKSEDIEKTHKLFLCEYIDGEPNLGECPEYEKMKRDKTFIFEPKWISISEISALEITPKVMKDLFIATLEKVNITR
jgi:ADP-ribose pyrophosphatase YjhB (NUDIX family)